MIAKSDRRPPKRAALPVSAVTPKEPAAASRTSLSAMVHRLVPVALAVYWILIFTGTHVPLPDMPVTSHGRDKVLHVVAYAGLGWLLGMYFWARGRCDATAYLMVFLFVAAYAAIDELLQIPVGRRADFRDWVADIAGCLIGLAALRVTQGVYRRMKAGETTGGRGSRRAAVVE